MNTSRRDFLKGLLGCLATAAVAPYIDVTSVEALAERHPGLQVVTFYESAYGRTLLGTSPSSRILDEATLRDYLTSVWEDGEICPHEIIVHPRMLDGLSARRAL